MYCGDVNGSGGGFFGQEEEGFAGAFTNQRLDNFGARARKSRVNRKDDVRLCYAKMGRFGSTVYPFMQARHYVVYNLESKWSAEVQEKKRDKCR